MLVLDDDRLAALSNVLGVLPELFAFPLVDLTLDNNTLCVILSSC